MKTQLTFIVVITSLLLFSCKKDKPKHLVATKWKVDKPVIYSLSSGGNNIGVGATALEWEIMELDFTNGQEGAKSTGTDYYGSGSIMRGNSYSNGTQSALEYTWDSWTYKDYGTNENQFKTYTWDIPQEWRDEDKCVGVLYNKSGTLNMYVFSLSKKKMKVAFLHINSFSSGTNTQYYSPIMNFSRD